MLVPLLLLAALARAQEPMPVALTVPALAAAGVDEDHDGLQDASELELASAFRPYVVFDSHENARRPDEPVVVYQVRPLGCAGPRSKCGRDPLRARITYLLLWQWDGGYGPASWCGDKHQGDNQPVNVVARSWDDGATWELEGLTAWGFSWPKNHATFVGGPHFALYPSSGKHHYFLDRTYDGQRSPYSKWGCKENVDGLGDQFLVRLSGNVGEPENHPEPPFTADLGGAGFPGENAYDTRGFCGGLPCPNGGAVTSKNATVWSREPYRIP